MHEYRQTGNHYVVTLKVQGPGGEDLCCKVWEVMVEGKKGK